MDMRDDDIRELGLFVLYMFEINKVNVSRGIEILSIWGQMAKDIGKIESSKCVCPSIEENKFYTRVFGKKSSEAMKSSEE